MCWLELSHEVGEGGLPSSGPSGRALSKNHQNAPLEPQGCPASHLALTLLARRATVTLGLKPGWRMGRARTPASSGWAPLHSEQFPSLHPVSLPQSAPPRRACRPALDPGLQPRGALTSSA